MNKILSRVAFFSALFIFPISASALDKPFDHSAWEKFLQTYVNDAGEVDYARVKREPELLDQYLNSIAAIGLKEFPSWPREERLALCINLYHAAIIKTAVSNYPIKSLQQIPGVWDIPVVKLNGRMLSLNQLRESELVGQFRDEKIHTALFSGAKSAPKLRREAYTGPKVEGQLYLAARDFVNDAVRNPIQPGKKHLQISRIFKWYAADFKLDFGYRDDDDKYSVEENSVLAFLAYYLDDRAKIEYLEDRTYKIKYLPFDWDLNDWKASASSVSAQL